MTMARTLKSLARIATTALIAFTAGCGAVEETNTNEAGAPVGTISQELGTTYTISSWPSTFPVQANAAPVTAAIPLSNGLKIIFIVDVATEGLPALVDGLVTISYFSYAGVLASSPNQLFAFSKGSGSGT